MFKPLCAALIVLCSTMAAGNASADEYSIRYGEPPLGSSLPPNKAGLGIKVDVDKTWEQLSPQEKLVWRDFTELTEPAVTPPFPLPNIRGFLRKLSLPDRLNYAEQLEQSASVLLVVHVSESGNADQIDIMEGSTPGSTVLTDYEKVLSYQFIVALQHTKFSPAMLNGKPAPCAFPFRISGKTLMY